MNSIQKQIRAYKRDIIEDAKLVELVEQEVEENIREKEQELEHEILNES